MPDATGPLEGRDARLDRILRPNGEAGTVEVHPDGTPEYQHYVAQAGPFREGTQVVVLGPNEIEEIRAALRSPVPEGVWICAHCGGLNPAHIDAHSGASYRCGECGEWSVIEPRAERTIASESTEDGDA